MRGRAAHIKLVDGSAVVRPTGDRTKEKELLEREFALENISLREAELALEIERRENLAPDDNLFDVGGMFGDGVDDSVAEGFALFVPRPSGELVRRVLNEARHNVLARWSDAWIGQAGNDDINVRLARKMAVLRVVIGALHVFDAGRNGNRTAEMRAGAGQALEIGKRVKREIHFARRTSELVAPDAFEKIAREFTGVEKFFKSEMRIDAGRDDFGGDLFAGLQDNAAGAAVFDDDFRDARLRANLHAGFAGGVGDSTRNGSSAAAAEAPRWSKT